MEQEIALTVNGEVHRITADPQMPLMYALRDLLGLTGTKYGCGVGQCGSCSVLLDGERVCSCDMPVSKAEGCAITTIEGLAAKDDLHPIQQAIVAENALQCGYCTPGFVLAAKALLDQTPAPDERQIRVALQDNICRCGSYSRIIAAVQRAAREMRR